MKKALSATILCTAAIAIVRAQAPQPAAAPLTPAQTLDRRAIGELDFSPDGSRLVFTVTDPPKGASRPRALWMLDVASARLRQLTFSGKSDGGARWSPDGSSIAFVSDRDGAPQLYRLPLAGGEAEKLTDRKEAVGAFRWSPDGRRIVFLMAEAKPDAQQQRERDKDDARVVDKENRRPRLWTVDVTSHQLKQITSGGWRIDQFDWRGSSDRVVAIATPTPEVDQWTERLYTIDLDGGDFKEISAPRGPLGGLALSADGQMAAYLGARVDGPDAHDLYLQPVAGGAARNLTASAVDRPIAQPRWIDDQSLVAGVSSGFKSALVIVDRNGSPRMLDGFDVNPTTFARSASGTVAYVGETATRAPELWIKAPTSAARAMTSFNQQWASLPIVAPEFVKYKSADGVEIEAALLVPSAISHFQDPASHEPSAISRFQDPASHQPSAISHLQDPAQPSAISHQPYPFVVLVHGGPTGRWSDTFEPWGQLLAARGYAVLYPNVRGSTGYGARFVEMNRADWGGGDFKDVMAGVDAMIARGVADPNRLGIGGWSYGGYMAAWAVTQTNRFKAAVSGAPVIDMASEFGTENGSAYDEWFYGTPYEKLDGFIKSSPMTFVKHVKTPTLLLQGEDDTTDPIGQSQQFHRGLKRYNVETALVVYPREPHGLREEKHLLDRLTRIVAWYDTYVKPASPSTAQP